MEIRKSLIHWITDLEPAKPKGQDTQHPGKGKTPQDSLCFNFSARTGCPGNPGKKKKTKKRGQTISKIFHR